MRSLSFFTFFVLLALTSASPSRKSLSIPLYKRSTLVRDGVADLGAVRSHIAHSRRKYLNGLATLDRRYAVHSSSSGDAFTTLSVGSDPLTDDSNERWYGPICVGTPCVQYTVVFDTGSADTFLPGQNCGSSCSGHTLYDPTASSTAINLHANFSLSYGDGSSTSGKQYADTVIIGDLVAKNQTIGAATVYSSGFQSASFVPDGLLGMAFQNISKFGASPVVQTLITEKQLSRSVFSFKIASNESELRFGGVNPSLYTGSFTYTPVTQQGYWQIELDSINVDGQAVIQKSPAIIDTGTTLILGDEKVVDQFYSAVNATSIGNGLYTMSCDSMPSVSLTIGGRDFSMSADTFNFGTYTTSNNSCIGAIAGTGSLGDVWIIGDVFLRNVYSVFDLGQLQVGFADLA